MSAATTAVVRPMRWWDIEAVMPIEHELFGDEAWTETMLWSELAERSNRWYVVVDGDRDGELAAYAGLCVFTTHEAYVQTLAVAERHQRRGLGTVLLRSLVEEATRRGCRQLDLEVRADNEAAQQLYVRHGFQAIGRRRAYYQPSGIDAIVMRKPLPDQQAVTP
jgi:ribosomal-protein-alanine N-acetyltransferase